MDEKDNFLIVRQYRPNLGKHTFEFPAGGIEKNENSHQALIREILEETGYIVKNYLYLGPFRVQMHRSINLEHVYFCINPVFQKKG